MEIFGAEPDRVALNLLVHGRLNDPFSVLGPHQTAQGRAIRAYFLARMESRFAAPKMAGCSGS